MKRQIFIVLLGAAFMAFSLTACTPTAADGVGYSSLRSSEIQKSSQLEEEASSVGTSTQGNSSQGANSNKGSSKAVSKINANSSVVSNQVVSVPIYPITQRANMLAGTEIPFIAGVNINIHQSDDDHWFNISIAKSFAELTEIFADDYNPNQINYIHKYNDAFFQENALIIMFITEGSGSVKHRIDSLVKNEDDLCVGFTRLVPETGTGDIAYWRILLEVKKSDIEDIVKLSYFVKGELMS